MDYIEWRFIKDEKAIQVKHVVYGSGFQTVLKSSACCKEVTVGVSMVVKKMLVAGCRPPLLRHYFIQSSFTFTLGFRTVFIQMASWPHSLSKTNDLRISCSQNAYRFYLGVFLESDSGALRDALR